MAAPAQVDVSNLHPGCDPLRHHADLTRQMPSTWTDCARSGSPLQVNTEMMRLTMTVISHRCSAWISGTPFQKAGQALRFILQYAPPAR